MIIFPRGTSRTLSTKELIWEPDAWGKRKLSESDRAPTLAVNALDRQVDWHKSSSTGKALQENDYESGKA